MEHIHDIYDRIAKRCISLSAKCTINLINGLYGTDYPADSQVTYNWTEHEDDNLRKTLADTIITINNRHSYHIEFQMTADGDIILRMLEYGFPHALRSLEEDTISFPEPVIIYLYHQKNIPEEYALHIRFGTQGTFTYRVPVFKYLDKSLEELDDRKMIVLIPFQLLRLRRAIEKERTAENMAALKNLISHDILDSLNRNVAVGNISHTEALKLSRMILFLYHHIYDRFEELEREGVHQVAEDALIFDVDILDDRIQKLEAERERLEAEKGRLESEKGKLESEMQQLETEKQIWKLLALGHTLEEISSQLEIPLNELKILADQS